MAGVGVHHVAAGVTLRPVDLLDEAGLFALVIGTER
jgi:DNA helicase II / ATP-dependent DNA helicase PcrA